MGQRLVVDLMEGNKVVAAVYYHWSAYFTSTIWELAKLSDTILAAEKNNKDKLLAIVEMLEEQRLVQKYDGTHEERHGGVRGTPEDIEAAEKLFPDHKFVKENVNRNEGVISFTKEGIDNFHAWEEGHASIHLETHRIINDVDLDPDPFELDAEYEEDEYGEKQVQYYTSGIITINGHRSPVDAFDCTCESILDLVKFMDKEYEIYKRTHSEGTA